MSNIDYSDPNNTPPIGQAVPLGLQHVLAMFASNVTPSIIVAGAAGLAFGGAVFGFGGGAFILLTLMLRWFTGGLIACLAFTFATSGWIFGIVFGAGVSGGGAL